eukprot:IDg716t1
MGLYASTIPPCPRCRFPWGSSVTASYGRGNRNRSCGLSHVSVSPIMSASSDFQRCITRSAFPLRPLTLYVIILIFGCGFFLRGVDRHGYQCSLAEEAWRLPLVLVRVSFLAAFLLGFLCFVVALHLLCLYLCRVQLTEPYSDLSGSVFEFFQDPVRAFYRRLYMPFVRCFGHRRPAESLEVHGRGSFYVWESCLVHHIYEFAHVSRVAEHFERVGCDETEVKQCCG